MRKEILTTPGAAQEHARGATELVIDGADVDGFEEPGEVALPAAWVAPYLGHDHEGLRAHNKISAGIGRPHHRVAQRGERQCWSGRVVAVALGFASRRSIVVRSFHACLDRGVPHRSDAVAAG
jgi:hypothetical protein